MMKFSEFLKKLTKEQVNIWWDSIAPENAPKNIEENNWKYKLAKNKLKVPLNLYDGNNFPYQDNQFDKVYSCLVFHQLDAETKNNCLNEIYRVLKPDGKLIIADWGKASNTIMRITFGLVQMLDGFKTTNDNVKGKMPQFIEKGGFHNVIISQSINTIIGTFSYFRAIKK